MRRERRVKRERQHRGGLRVAIDRRDRGMHKDADAPAVNLIPERIKRRIVEIAAADIRIDQHADAAEFVEAPRHLSERTVDIVKGQMSKGLEPLRIAPA